MRCQRMAEIHAGVERRKTIAQRVQIDVRCLVTFSDGKGLGSLQVGIFMYLYLKEKFQLADVAKLRF